MKKLLTKKQYIAEHDIYGADLWLNTQYEEYVYNQRFKMPRDVVSTSMYLYQVEAPHFDRMVVNQETFVSVRARYLESTIASILEIDSELRDDERLSACIKARTWCEKMARELRE